jgi:hypothetical protein
MFEIIDLSDVAEDAPISDVQKAWRAAFTEREQAPVCSGCFRPMVNLPDAPRVGGCWVCGR